MTWRSKLSFGLGGLGQDLVYAIVSTYLMKYMTDVQLVDPMFVAVLSIFCMVVYKRGYRLTDEFYHHVLAVLRGEESRAAGE